MNISRLLPFLSLLVLLPATSDAAIMIPRQQPNLKPDDLCPLINIVEHELCISQEAHAYLHEHPHNNEHLYDFKDLCVLLQEYNTTICSSKKERFVTKPINYDVMSIDILKHEFHNMRKHHGSAGSA